MYKTRHKKLFTWVIIPLCVTALLMAVNWWMLLNSVEWLRYLVVFVLAWTLYIASSMLRGAHFSKQTVALCALFAGIFTFSLINIIASAFTNNRTLMSGWDLHVDVFVTYLVVLIVLSIISMAVVMRK